MVIVSSDPAPTLSNLTAEGGSAARSLGEKRDLASDILGLKSWVYLLPNSVVVGEFHVYCSRSQTNV